MRRNLVGIAVVAALAVLVIVGWKRCGGSDDDTAASAASGSASGGAGAGGVRRSGPAGTPASIAGHVYRKADHAGVGGAVVALARADFGAMIAPDESPTIVAISGADGSWRVDAIAPGNYTVAATAANLLPASREKLLIGAGAKLTDVDFTLDAGGYTLRGTVNDVGGGAIGGARVTAEKSSHGPFDSKADFIAITGTDGQYQLTLADGEYEVTASHDDYTRQRHQVEIAGGPRTQDFVLVPGGVIRGDVVTRDGKPVPQAIVEASGGRSRGGRGHHAQTRTDDNGKFMLRGLGSGAISLTASGKLGSTSAPVVVEIGIAEQVDNIKIIVDRAYSISGRVVEKGKQTGVAGVMTAAFSMAGGTGMSPEPTPDDGSFEIVGLKPGTYILIAISESMMPEMGKSVEVVDKDVTGVVVELAAGVTLSGRVEPPAVATLGLELDPSKIGIGNMFEVIKTVFVRGESAADGTFALKHVPPGMFTLVASVTDGRRGKLPVVVADVDQQGLVIQLEPRASIAGRVVDPSGAAVVGVHVDARVGDGKTAFVMTEAGRGGGLTASDGSFKVVGLEAGTANVSVSDDQGKLAWADTAHKEKPNAPQTFELAKGQALTGVVLTVEARDGTIRGIVLGPDKKPAGDAWVSAYHRRDKTDADDKMREVMQEFGDARVQPTLTGADGKFVFDHLRRGTYELVAEGARGSSRISKSGVKTGDSVTLELESLGTLTGRLTSGATPIAEYDLQCKGPIARIDRRISAADGAYSLERLAPGSYTCSARADAGVASGTVDVPPGPAKLDLSAMPWASVTGTVVHAVTGQPVVGLHVVVNMTGDFDGKQMGDLLLGKGPMTDAAGRFVVERVAQGKATVEVMPPTGGMGFEHLTSKEFVATSGQRTDVGTLKVIPPRTGDAGTFGIYTNVDNGALVVTQVKPDGPAAKAGIQAGDKIVAIAGVPLTGGGSGAELGAQMLANGHIGVGETLQLTLDRNGTQIQASMTSVRW